MVVTHIPSPQSCVGALQTSVQEPESQTPCLTLVDGQTFPHAPQFVVVSRLTQVPSPEQSPYPEAQTQTLEAPQI